MKRFVPLLILVCLLTLLPFKTVTADDSSMGGEVTILPGLAVDTSLTTKVEVSSETAVAIGSDGEAIVVSEGWFDLEISDSKGVATLPIELEEGKELESFSDSSTGLEVTKTTFTLPVKDVEGITKSATISGEIEKIEGKGVTTEVIAKNIKLTSEEFEVDLTSQDEKIGKAAASFQTSLKSLPQGAALKATVSKDPDPTAQAAFQLTVLEEGNKVSDVACTLNIEKTNLENGTDLGEATIIMKAGRAWAEEYGIDNIFIMRYSDEGESQKLPTTFIGYEEGDGGEQAVFEAVSADGFSVFGLAAVTSRPGSSHWVLIITSVGGSIIAAGLIIFFILWRRRRREALLKVMWPTGMRQEDWEISKDYYWPKSDSADGMKTEDREDRR